MPDLFEPGETYTTTQKVKALEREIGQRRYVYPRRVADGKMKQVDADFQIAIFEDMAADYRKKL